MALTEHLEKLRHFYRLASYRSIKSGAQGMGISQAGLSKSLASLENVLEVQLFTRSSEGLVLTKEGEIVLKATKKILSEAESVETNLRSLKAAKVPSKFKIGMYDSIAIYFFPNLSSYLKEIYPTIELELVVDRSSNLQDMIRKREIDLAVGVNFVASAENKNFELFEDHYAFFCSPKIADDLNKRPLIFHPDAGDKNSISVATHVEKITATRLGHRVYNIETIKELTVLGYGIGVLPTQVAKPLLDQKLLVQTKITKMPNLFGQHSIGFLATNAILKRHQEFVEDIYRLGIRWSKN